MSDETMLESPEQPNAHDGAAKLVPVAESIKYRRRAQQAESRLQEFGQQLEDLQTQLEGRSEELAAAEAQRDEARQTLLATENRLSVQRALSEAGVVDLETASLLLSKRMNFDEGLGGDAIARGVEQLLLDKPFLRDGTAGHSGSLPPGTASPRSAVTTPGTQLAQAAERAARSGSRKEVADYLRLRRQVALSRERAADL